MPASPVASTLDIPISIFSIHLDHLHSVYIAVGTLLIVSITVTVRHCRLHKTYRNCSVLPFRSVGNRLEIVFRS
ncbi:Hypothetical predicted protein [Cloeon dipterum]|uniref:Uncharacterized protein n=1 Tax=Cloeon dipterum TaxID=197152 RepID=A0A8S1E316_9INSE|nr:Hypothetical predicted protein [Cloeon dipterum]